MKQILKICSRSFKTHNKDQAKKILFWNIGKEMAHFADGRRFTDRLVKATLQTVIIILNTMHHYIKAEFANMQFMFGDTDKNRMAPQSGHREN